ncbi:MAG: exodeoxyribonuclease VII large subunit [Bacteroidales bacterium]|jgi:exodeoxyribonuclease VII large subunit|nr:exodeoxyribonuclease VII large subunit [Bacteroidales bacterium]
MESKIKGEGNISLSELLQRVKESVENSVPDAVWVRGDVADVSVSYNGHCYIELTDYDEREGGMKAKARAVIWSSKARMLLPFFETSVGSPLASGMHILVKALVQFSPVYGLSLLISDIEPAFTVGEYELKRRKTIVRLEKDGVMDMNKGLELPVLPRRFAVISSASAAGYSDFMRHLSRNEYGFVFETELFDSVMQGRDAPSSIIAALNEIQMRLLINEKTFDAVVMIRGGGSPVDMYCFDDYELCLNLAQFPIPVISGVGHDRDMHVCDMVACRSVKTPTAAADFIIGIYIDETSRLESLAYRLSNFIKQRAGDFSIVLDRYETELGTLASALSSEYNSRLDLLESRLKATDPGEALKKGFSIIRLNGRSVNSCEDFSEGDILEIFLGDGKIKTRLADIEKSVF